MQGHASTRELVRLICYHADCLNYLIATHAWGRRETGRLFMDDDADLFCNGCGREMEIQP